MDYFNEHSVDTTPADWYVDCYNKGGRLMYWRMMSHYGSCSAKIPCDVTSTEDTIIYEYVCV